MDYDSQRHSNQLVNNGGGAAGKKKDEAKIMKAKEQFDEVKRKFDLINTELHDELPALYNSRVLFLITNLQPYFAAEQLFHSESSKVRAPAMISGVILIFLLGDSSIGPCEYQLWCL